MLHFQTRPDRVFLAIFHEALERTREELDFAPIDAPTHEDHEAIDELYGELYPQLTRFFERLELVEVLDRLLQTQQEPTVFSGTSTSSSDRCCSRRKNERRGGSRRRGRRGRSRPA